MRMLLGILLLAVSSPAVAAGVQDLPAGRALAIDACSACHQVTPDQPQPPSVFDPDEQVRVLAPPFAVIAKKYVHRTSALRRIILSPVHPMREQNWDPADLSAVTTFIQSLSRPAAPNGVPVR